MSCFTVSPELPKTIFKLETRKCFRGRPCRGLLLRMLWIAKKCLFRSFFIQVNRFIYVSSTKFNEEFNKLLIYMICFDWQRQLSYVLVLNIWRLCQHRQIHAYARFSGKKLLCIITFILVHIKEMTVWILIAILFGFCLQLCISKGSPCIDKRILLPSCWLATAVKCSLLPPRLLAVATTRVLARRPLLGSLSLSLSLSLSPSLSLSLSLRVSLFLSFSLSLSHSLSLSLPR